MRKEIEYITKTLQSIIDGEPWYGRPAMKILKDIDPSAVFKNPGGNSHSLIELIYHMNTWAEFTLKSLAEADGAAITEIEKLDWRRIDPGEHSWDKGVAQFKVNHDLMIELLNTKDDEFLSKKVGSREYNFRFLLHGIIQHDIYHLGQVAYVKKLLAQGG